MHDRNTIPNQQNVTDLIREHKWQELIDHLTSETEMEPCVYTRVYTQSITPLHIACSIPSVPTRVIKTLIKSYRHACLVEDEDGRLPIHLASTTPGISLQVIHTLMVTSPQSCFIKDFIYGDIPIYLVLKHNGSTDINHRLKQLISSIPSSCIYNESTSLIHIFCDKLLPDIVIVEVIKTFPQVLRIQNENGDTILHLLCSHKHSMAQTVLHAANLYPKACSLKNSDGNLPLHLAISRQDNDKIIKRLLDLYPRGVLISNFFGETPLFTRHFMESPMKVKALLSYSEHADVLSLLRTRNRDGMLPVEAYFYNMQQNISDLCHRDGILSSFSRIRYDLEVANQTKSLTYLMRSYVHGSLDSENICGAINSVHSTFLWTAFPLFTKLLLEYFPLLAKEKDCNGDFPLHILTKYDSNLNAARQCSICNILPISGPYFWCDGTCVCCHCNEAYSHNYSHLLKRHFLIEYESRSNVLCSIKRRNFL